MASSTAASQPQGIDWQQPHRLPRKDYSEDKGTPGGTAAASSAGPAARPTGLDIPAAARMVAPSSHPMPPAPWSQMSESHAMKEQAASLVGVSIGREQTRLTSPTTPAAEKSAALDRTNSWGFFDGTVEEREQLEKIKEDEQEAQAKHDDRQLDHALPSPWVSGPRLHEIVKDRSRSRGNSLFNSSLPDINVKQIWQSFNAPSLTDALQKFSPLGTSKDGQTMEKRSSRSNSLFTHRMTFGNMGRKDGSSSPRRRTGSSHTSAQQTPTLKSSPFGSRFESGESTPGSESPERLESSRTFPLAFNTTKRQDSDDAIASAPRQQLVKDDADGTSRPKRPTLRRAASDGSMISRASTVYSFDANREQFANIDGMVNSRFKAVKDSWQDSSFRFKNVNLMPDFLKGPDDVGILKTRSIAGIFGDNSSTPERSQNVTPPDSPKASRQPVLDTALEQLTGDLVLMGGYRGSILRSAEPPNRQLWVPIKVGLNVRKVNLEVGLNPEDEETEHERIFASGILSHIGPIDISRRLIRRFRSSKNCRNGTLRFHDYGYDWRLSPELLGRQLIKFLEGLPCNQPGIDPSRRGATVIAHSLGGLITRWAVNQRPELFAGVIFAGTPQHCVNILGPLRNGDDVLLSSKVLTAQVNFTLRTSFALLPETGRCFIDKDTGEEYRVDFFDPKQWEEYKWSPCVGYPLPPSDRRPGRSNSIIASIRDSVPALPSLTSKSAANLLTNFGGGSTPSPQQSAEPEQTVSSVKSAEDEVERKVADLAHPGQQTMNPSMEQPAMPGPATTVTIPHDRAMEYLTRTLADTLRFKKALSHRVEHEDSNAYPPLSVLYATCVPTVYGAQVAGRDGIRRTDAYDNLVFAAGDGVVLARASMLPKGYHMAEGGRVQTDRGHVGLLGDLEAVGKCLISVTNARRKGVGLGTQHKEALS